MPMPFRNRCFCFLICASTAASVGMTAVRSADAPPATADSEIEGLVAFLRNYDRALADGDGAFLGRHTIFPLALAGVEYDMEAKVRRTNVLSVANLLKNRNALRWPENLVPKDARDLRNSHRGVEKCADADHPDVPDFNRGSAALHLEKEKATLTYLAEPCAAEAHFVVLEFTRRDREWMLSGRTVRRYADGG